MARMEKRILACGLNLAVWQKAIEFFARHGFFLGYNKRLDMFSVSRTYPAAGGAKNIILRYDDVTDITDQPFSIMRELDNKAKGDQA